MQEAFDKIIEKLEAKQNKADEKCKDIVVKEGHSLEYEFYNGMSISFIHAIEIVKQAAAEYNNAIIDGKYCFQTCTCTEKCEMCSRLCNGDTDWYENIDDWCENCNNGWIPCSEQLPENSNNILIYLSDGYVNVGYYSSKEFRDMNSYLYKDVIAWQPLPEPYKET